MVLGLGKGMLKNLVMGIVAGIIVCYIYETAKLWGYGETITIAGMTVYKQFLIFASIAGAIAVYGFMKRKALISIGIGFLIGTEIKSRWL